MRRPVMMEACRMPASRRMRLVIRESIPERFPGPLARCQAPAGLFPGRGVTRLQGAARAISGAAERGKISGRISAHVEEADSQRHASLKLAIANLYPMSTSQVDKGPGP